VLYILSIFIRLNDEVFGYQLSFFNLSSLRRTLVLYRESRKSKVKNQNCNLLAATGSTVQVSDTTKAATSFNAGKQNPFNYPCIVTEERCDYNLVKCSNGWHEI
jgi:hypothetical protein